MYLSSPLLGFVLPGFVLPGFVLPGSCLILTGLIIPGLVLPGLVWSFLVSSCLVSSHLILLLGLALSCLGGGGGRNNLPHYSYILQIFYSYIESYICIGYFYFITFVAHKLNFYITGTITCVLWWHTLDDRQIGIVGTKVSSG